MVITGEVTDVSPYSDYHFLQEIFVEDPMHGEHLAYWCGPADKAMIFSPIMSFSMTWRNLYNAAISAQLRMHCYPTVTSILPH